MNIFLDIETVPPQRDDLRLEVVSAIIDRHHKAIEALDAEIAAIAPPANYKDPAKIAEWNESERPKKVASLEAKKASERAGHLAAQTDAIAQTALDGFYGQIVCISYAIDEEAPVSIYRQGWETAERAILEDFFTALKLIYNPSKMERPVFVGHNHVAFDLPFIYKRAVINQIAPPAVLPINCKPWDDRVFDTMVKAAGDKGRIGMDRLCRVLGIPGKGDGMDGSKVLGACQEGRIDEVAAYCAADVIRTREIYNRLTFKAPR